MSPNPDQVIFEQILQLARTRCKELARANVGLDDTPLRSYGVDSLALIRLVSAIEDRFEIEIREHEVFATASVSDLVRLVRGKVES
jgi:acyl carrier protein